ncbi:serine/threonine protein kinase [Streptomyces buecherae]|uniref:non-specific serine/threonine protein kinase n=1 Tax=Streptomyces buecherae TaxID=2763006 RepID=A0A7H8NIL1_9ACTN|nr:serine/threonine protein kinase [Streptomyces buecherae]
MWLAHDTALGQDVALKRARTDDNSDRAFARLQDEARALAKFRRHENVVTLYDAVKIGEPPAAEFWLVMEYASGGSLAGRPPISPHEAASIGAQIAGALEMLHAEGVVHCDVKPGNIVLGDKTAKLTDLDAAYRLPGFATRTPNRGISYTPDYAAPEVVQGMPVPESDVFSLGATLYELVLGHPTAGHPPGSDGDASSRRSAPDAAPVRPDDETHVDSVDGVGGAAGDGVASRLRSRGDLARLNGDVGPLRETLDAMLSVQPHDRPTAAEACRLLRRIAAEADQPPAPDADERQAGKGHWRPTGRLPWVVGSAAVAVAVLATVVLLRLPFGDDDKSGEKDTAKGTSSQAAPPPAPRTASAERSIDPCGLVSTEKLSRFGEARLDPAYGNFNRCDVLVTDGEGSEVDIKVDLSNDPPSDAAPPARRVGGVGVTELPAESGKCTRRLLPGDGAQYSVYVTTDQFGDGPAPLCEMAEAAATYAAQQLDEGDPPRRTTQPAADSLSRQDACTLLDAEALSVVPGIDAGDPDVGYGNWECSWRSTTSKIVADLRFDRGLSSPTSTSRNTQLSGREAVVEPKADGSDTCRVRVVHRPYTDHNGRRATEQVHLVVTGPQPVNELCTMATDLATSAADELPPPRV